MKKLFIFTCCLFLSFVSFAKIIRVNISVMGGANNGNSWANAYSNLTTALGAAASGDKVWVAKGTYIPGSVATDFFLIPSGVTVLGGFNGTEAAANLRNFSLNVTILSGNSGTRQHIVGFNDVTDATTLDGFTISGAGGGAMGGGIYNLGGGTNVSIENCIIKQNSASQGGGMCNNGTTSPSNPTLKNCTFSQNTGGQGSGVFNYGPAGNVGGIYTNCVFDNNGTGQGSGMFTYVYNGGTSTLSFTNCEFKNHSNNYAFDCNGSNNGTTQLSFITCTFTNNTSGAIFNNTYQSTNNNTLTLTNCTFTQNGGTNYYYPYGGAVANYAQYGKCTSTVSGCTFTKNGGRTFYNDGSQNGKSNGTFTNCNFTENYGTALYNYGSYGQSNQTVTNCTFSKNGSDSNSDAAFFNHGTNGEAISIVSGCTFSENNRGALYNFQNFKGTARPTFTNCTFSKNAGGYYGGAVYNNGNGDYCPAFTDCKFLDNAATGDGAAVYNFFDYNSSEKNNTTFLRCTFTGNTADGYSGGGAVYNNFSGIVSVSFTDCVMKNNKATGSNSNGGAMVNYTNSSATGALTVTNCNFDENQASVLGGGVMNNGASISMTYTNCTFNKNKLTSSSSYNGGGGVYNYKYNGNEILSYTDCQFNENESNAFGGGVVNNGGYSGGSYKIQYLRCTINNNKTVGNGSYYSYGGGMCNLGVDDGLSLTDCSINGNTATYVESSVSKYTEGGGIYNNDSYPTLTNCTINSNKGKRGGGFYNISASDAGKETKLINCTIRGNEAIANGTGYDAGGDGGGVSNHNSSMTLLNCLIAGNSATDEGGGVLSGYYNTDVHTNLINCTISGNKAAFGGGIFYNSTPTNLKNTIVWGNSTQIEGYHDENLTYNYSLVQGLNPAGTGNLDGTLASNNPAFVGPKPFGSAPTTTGNYHLKPCSPAANVGDNTGISGTDLDGSPRIQNSIVDLGAYEGIIGAFTITKQPVNAAACSGQNATFSITATAVSGDLFYQWKRGSSNLVDDARISGANTKTLTISNVQPSDVGNDYSVELSNACGNTLSSEIVSLSYFELTGGITATGKLCTGNALKLSIATEGSSYLWKGPNNFSSSVKSPSVNISTTGLQTYSVTVMSSSGCSVSAQISLTMSTTPSIASVTASPNPLCKNQTANFNLTASGGTGYIWKGPNSFASSLEDPSVTDVNLSAKGVYSVSVTNVCGVVQKVYQLTVVNCAIPTRIAAAEASPENIEIVELKASPNPVEKVLTVGIRLSKPSPVSLQLIDAMGRTVGEWQLKEEVTEHRKDLDLSALTGGVYMIQAQSRSQKQTKRVVKLE